MQTGFCRSQMNFTDPTGEASLLAKANALDEYLAGVLPDKWQAARARFGIQTAGKCQTKNLWSFYLMAVATANSANKNESIPSDGVGFLASPFRLLANIASPSGGLSLVVVADHPLIKEDLSNAWHPAWQGTEMQAAESITEDELSQIKIALGLIEAASANATSLVNEVCAAICLLRTTDKLGPGFCVSLTSKLVPGLIYFTPAPVILTSESIVHEASHLWLSRFESSGDLLYSQPERHVASPLRLDPRPIGGLVHQIWVLSNLVPFYRDLLLLERPVIAANSQKLAKRMAQHAADLQAGLATVCNHKDAFTDRGRDFMECIASRAIPLWR